MARSSGLNNTTEYVAGKFPFPTRPTTRMGGPMSSGPVSMIRSDQTEEYPDTIRLRREMERVQSDREQRILERDQLRAKLGYVRKLQE